MKNLIKKFVLVLAISFVGFNSSAVLAKTIKIATLSPDGTFWMKQMRVGAKEIKEKTQGRVKFKFYPGGVMGNDGNVLRKIRIGQLHGASVTISTLSQTIPVLSREIEKNGFVNFGFAQGGFSYLMSKDPIRSLDDLRERKSWVPEKSEVGLSVYRYVGVTPISLPLSDVLTGLQTGLIDTIITPPIGALALQWHTHIEYVTDQPLNYLAAMLIIDKKVFKKLSETDQEIVRDVMGKVYKKIDEQNKVDNIAARKALLNQGVKFIKLSETDKEEWEKIDDFVINEMIKKYKYNKELYEAVTVNKDDAPSYIK
jgi:TRAP-type C4-dicarboxylate transport system substrate-binding protein